jgi:NAD+ kinase
MKIAAYCRNVDDDNLEFVRKALKLVKKGNHELLLHEYFKSVVVDEDVLWFSTYQDLKDAAPVDFMLSFGGDGSFIDAANVLADLGIPLVGVNTGRIGFLTSITKKNFEEYWNLLETGCYTIEERSLLHIDADVNLPLQHTFALNDISIHNTEVNSITGVKLWVNDLPANTYWADGLIVATPTGSTAYSLSCGGPIIHPQTQVNVITPISSHSLAVRPIVVSNNDVLKIEVLSRNEKFLLTVDSERITLENPVTLTISKENFTIKTTRFLKSDFYSVIREKLLWGIDLRNFKTEN